MAQLCNRIYGLGLLIIFGGVFFSCNQNLDDSAKNNHLKIVEVKGYVVPKDSIRQPKIVPAGNPIVIPGTKPKVTSIVPTLNLVRNPKVVVAGLPKICTPGQDSFSLPKIVPAIHHPVVAGLPKVTPAKEVSSTDPNPQNFSSFNKLQGLQHTHIKSIIEDKSGNLWIATDGGVVKYDGKTTPHLPKMKD